MGRMGLMGPMGNRPRGLSGLSRLSSLILPIFLAFFVSCSDDQETGRERVSIELMPYAKPLVEAGQPVQRALIPPAGYYPYSSLTGMFEGQADLTDNTIDIFFTKDGNEPSEGRFFYHSGKWHSSVEITSADTYYLYGFIPHIGSVTSTISSSSTPDDNSAYSNGAVLTISNLPAVTTNDVCVVVGAHNGYEDYDPDNDYSVTGLQTGHFDYVTTGGSNNYVFLLFDHLYSAMRFRLKVDETYNALRTIKLKKLELMPYNGSDAVKKKMTVTVTLAKKDDSSSPITSITYTPTGDYDSEGVLFENVSGTTLTTTYTDYKGCFAPTGSNKFLLRSTYDVYDKQGNITRSNCTADNVLDVPKLFIPELIVQRGKMYTVNLTVQPSYLYVLSDPDLDNPTIKLSGVWGLVGIMGMGPMGLLGLLRLMGRRLRRLRRLRGSIRPIRLRTLRGPICPRLTLNRL